ncbi:MAG: ABC transporter ATP-binding protein [Halobacteria archaeon]|nr:ABC transporter ATP-binding protein [Halobacteria archaeon]
MSGNLDRDSSKTARVDGDVVVEAEGISHSYGDTRVLDSVSFSLVEGSLNGIVGPNGSGKSTLVRILTGLLEATDGEVTVHGERDDGRQVGYLPQKAEYRSAFTVKETLEFYSRLVRDSSQSPEEALELVGLSGAADTDVDGLSGGMLRLLGIAQSTIGDPSVIFLDEPTSGLDPTMSYRIFEVLRDLADRGTTVVVTSHDLTLIETNVDRLLLLDEGRLQLDGSPEEVVETEGYGSLADLFGDMVEEKEGTTVRHGHGNEDEDGDGGEA